MKGRVAMNGLCGFLGLALFSLACLGQSEPQVETALATLEVVDRTVTDGELDDATAVIRAQVEVGDRAVWARLRNVIRGGEPPFKVRKRALLLACEKADRELATDILQVMFSIVRQLDGDRIRELPAEQTVALAHEARLAKVFLSDGLKGMEDLLDRDPHIGVPGFRCDPPYSSGRTGHTRPRRADDRHKRPACRVAPG